MADTLSDTKNYQVNRESGHAQAGAGDMVIVYCTFPSAEAAKAAGRALVERRLAACVNVVAGMTAIYQWEGRVHEDGEAIAIVKTVAGRIDEVFAAIKGLHSYENPALFALDVRAGAPAYLAWVKAQTGAA